MNKMSDCGGGDCGDSSSGFDVIGGGADFHEIREGGSIENASSQNFDNYDGPGCFIVIILMLLPLTYLGKWNIFKCINKHLQSEF